MPPKIKKVACTLQMIITQILSPSRDQLPVVTYLFSRQMLQEESDLVHTAEPFKYRH